MITLGIDEVGRGCWAGPLVIGAAIIINPLDGLKDSKLLTRNQRENLYSLLIKECQAYALGWVWPEEIDNLGLTQATSLGINRALDQIKHPYDEIIIDGHLNYLGNNPKAKCLIKADNLIPAVSAASIIAKVERDNYMIKLSKEYDNYGFDKHVGYGTKTHLASIKRFGICPVHRRSFKPIANAI